MTLLDLSEQALATANAPSAQEPRDPT